MVIVFIIFYLNCLFFYFVNCYLSVSIVLFVSLFSYSGITNLIYRVCSCRLLFSLYISALSYLFYILLLLYYSIVIEEWSFFAERKNIRFLKKLRISFIMSCFCKICFKKQRTFKNYHKTCILENELWIF